MTAPLTAARLRELLHYDPATGVFTWTRPTARCMKPGDVAGRRSRATYIQIKVDYRDHLAHRLAWLYVHGRWPALQIDHINGDRADNRIANLRDVSSSINTLNRHTPCPNRTTGYAGVFQKRGRFGARIKLGGRSIYLGTFDTPEEAHLAYLARRDNLTVLEEVQASARAAA